MATTAKPKRPSNLPNNQEKPNPQNPRGEKTQTMHIASLGSSFASGPSIPPQTNPTARRSALNYASLLSRRLGAKHTDLSASGATLLNVLNEPQECLLGTLPPQLEGLPADADIVTLTAGGNDLGYSAGMIGEAARVVVRDEGVLGVVLGGLGLSADGNGGGVAGAVGGEEVEERFVHVIDAVRAKAPGARVFLVEYLAVFGEETGVGEMQPLGGERVDAYRALAEVLKRAYAGAARRREGVVVVPVAEVSESHAVGSREPWVVGFMEGMLLSGGAPYHPNAAGHEAVAEVLEGHVRSALGV